MILKVGDKAPLFEGKDQDGKLVKLDTYRGQSVVLYFYPKDNTPGCTAEACSLRDSDSELKKAGYVVIGVSSDSEKSHKKFIEKYNLPFILIADVDKEINKAYGVWVEKSMYGKTYMGTARTTFVIDQKGIIVRIIDKVNTKNHAEQLLNN